MNRAAPIFAAAADAHAPQEDIPPSVWAERHLYLPASQTAYPGPWRNANAPHLAAIMDACAGWLQGQHREIEKVSLMKSVQSGGSQAVRVFMAYVACREPDPFMYVMPNEQDATKIFRKRILPMFRDTPVLRALHTSRAHDLQITDVTLRNGFTMRPAWAGSPSTLASDPIRYVFNDEVDKYPPFSGREADPVALAEMRTMTYGDRRTMVTISTPTTRAGAIWDAYDKSEIKLEFRIPCPRCGEYQPLRFDYVKWPKVEAATWQEKCAIIRAQKLAWLECEHCEEKIPDDDKPEICGRGVWVTHEQHVKPDGTIVGDLPEGKSVGFHLNCLPVLLGKWASFSTVAAEFISSKDTPKGLMKFRNQYLGEIFEDRMARPSERVFKRKLRDNPPPAGIVPKWAAGLVAGADTQKDHFWYVLRAFGHVVRQNDDGSRSIVKRSQLITHGRCATFADLRRICLDSRYPVEDDAGFLMPEVLAIDSGGGTKTDTGGNRTAEVYEFALTDPARIWAVKGHGGKQRPTHDIRASKVSYRRGTPDQIDITLRILNTVEFKDQIASDLVQPPGEPNEFLINDGCGDEYIRHMTSEQKIATQEGHSGMVERWVPVTTGAANHLWDAENYARAAAVEKQLSHGMTREEVVHAEELRRTVPRKPQKQLRTPDGRPFLVTRR